MVSVLLSGSRLCALLVAVASLPAGAVLAVPFDIPELSETPRGPTVSPELPENDIGEDRGLGRIWSKFSRGDFPAAETEARALVSERPDSAEGWYLLGLSLANLDRVEEAIDALDRSAGLYTRNAGPLTVKGDLLLSSERTEAAKRAYDAAVERDPTDWRAQEQLGIMAEEENDVAAAIAHYQQALTKLPHGRLFPRARLAALYSAAGDAGRAVDVLQPFVLLNPRDGEGLKAMGRAQILAERPGDAMETLARAVAVAPEDSDALLSRATAELSAGEMQQARDTLDAVRGMAPRTADLAFVEGRLALAQGRAEDAVRAFRDASEISGKKLALAPFLARALVASGETEAGLGLLNAAAKAPSATPQVMLTLGELQAATGDLGAAEATYLALSDSAPEVVTAHLRLGSVRAAQGRYDEALADFDRGLAIDPENGKLLRGATLAAMRLGRKGAALGYADRLVQSRAAKAPSLMLLAWVQTESDNAAAARTSYRDILKLEPGNVGALNNLAVLLSDGEDLAEAERLAAAARDAAPQAPFVWHTLGKIAQASGRAAESVAMFRKAAELAPQDASYALDLGLALLGRGADDEGKALLARSLDLGLPPALADTARSHLN